MIVNNTLRMSIQDELINKVKVLSIALKEANEIIETLEGENTRLKELLNIIPSEETYNVTIA